MRRFLSFFPSDFFNGIKTNSLHGLWISVSIHKIFGRIFTFNLLYKNSHFCGANISFSQTKVKDNKGTNSNWFKIRKKPHHTRTYQQTLHNAYQCVASRHENMLHINALPRVTANAFVIRAFVKWNIIQQNATSAMAILYSRNDFSRMKGIFGVLTDSASSNKRCLLFAHIFWWKL